MEASSSSIINIAFPSNLERWIRWILIRLIFLDSLSKLSPGLVCVHTSPPELLDLLSNMGKLPESQQQGSVNRAATPVSDRSTHGPHWLQQSGPQHFNYQPTFDARVHNTQHGAQATPYQDRIGHESIEKDIRLIPLIKTPVPVNTPGLAREDSSLRAPQSSISPLVPHQVLRPGPSRVTSAWKKNPNEQTEKETVDRLLDSISSSPTFKKRPPFLGNLPLLTAFCASFRHPIPPDQHIWKLAGSLQHKVISHRNYRRFKRSWVRSLPHGNRADAMNDAGNALGAIELRTLGLEVDHKILLEDLLKRWFVSPVGVGQSAIFQGRSPEGILRSVSHATIAALYLVRIINGVFVTPLYKTIEELEIIQRRAFKLWAMFLQNLDVSGHDAHQTETGSSNKELLDTEVQDQTTTTELSERKLDEGAHSAAEQDLLVPTSGALFNEKERAISVLGKQRSKLNRAEQNVLHWILVAHWLREERWELYKDLHHAKESLLKDFKGLVDDKLIHTGAIMGLIPPHYNVVFLRDFRLERPEDA